jgi:hypothetical protein
MAWHGMAYGVAWRGMAYGVAYGVACNVHTVRVDVDRYKRILSERSRASHMLIFMGDGRRYRELPQERVVLRKSAIHLGRSAMRRWYQLTAVCTEKKWTTVQRGSASCN